MRSFPRWPGTFTAFFRSQGDLWLALGLVFLAVYFFSGYFTSVRFDQERIVVEIERGRIGVTGFYHYANRSRLPAALTLGVPFPTDQNHPAPESLWVAEVAEDGHELVEIPPAVRHGEAEFRLIFSPHQAKWVRIEYTQSTWVRSGRYLLTTTRAWRRPITRADYVLRLPSGLQLTASNYPLRPVPSLRGWKAYSFSKAYFYPDQDWSFAWSDAGGRPAPLEGGRR